MSPEPTFHLKLDPHSGEAIYRQVVEQVKYRIACGRLQGGDQLPSIRALASQLKVNTRTIVKAYEELKHAGLVVMRQGQGVFVSDRRAGMPVSARKRQIESLARRLIAEASRLGAGPDEVLAIVEKVAEEMKS